MPDYNKLFISPSWMREYYTKYPHGLSVLENIIEWVNQVNELIDYVNITPDRIAELLNQWKDDGTIEEILERVYINVKEDLRSRAVNIRDYGAKGDGITDDYNSFVAALEDMNYQGVLYIPKGKYNLSKPLHLGRLAGDSITPLLCQDLHIIGETSLSTVLYKTTADEDISGKNSLIYTNGVRLRIHDLGLSGQGIGYGVNFRSFHTQSHFRDVFISGFETAMYLDSMYIASIKDIHVKQCTYLFDSSAADKTSLTVDQVWGENIGQIGNIQKVHYSNWGTITADWVNIGVGNPYPVPVTITDPLALIRFIGCVGLNIGVLACEHANARSLVCLESSSVNIDVIRSILFENKGTTLKDLNNNDWKPLIYMRGVNSVRKSAIRLIECNDPELVNAVLYNDYPSSSYGSKKEAYLKIDIMPAGVPAWGENVTACNTAVMFDYPGGVYPLYWDNNTPYTMQVVGGVLSAVAVPFVMI